MYITKYFNSLFIGNDYSVGYNKNIEQINREKHDKIQTILEKQKLTESQFLLRKNYINKLERIAMSLRTESIFKNIHNPVIIYDVNLKVLDYNKSFADTFLNKHKINNIVVSHDSLNKTDIINDYIDSNNTKISYLKEYIVDINNNKYKVTISPLYDSAKNLECFIRIYTKI